MRDVTKSIWIDAPPEEVFTYFTDQRKFARWAGASTKLDPVPGGIFRHDMGVSGVITGKFVDVKPGKFLSWEIQAPKNVDAPSSIVEITLTPEADGTRVDIRQTGLTPPFDIMASRGWDHHLARLSVTIQGGRVAEDSLCKRTMESLTG